MYQYALSFFAGIFNKVKYFFSCKVFLVKQDLVFLVEPVEWKVDHANGFPVVGYLPACTVDNVTDLVGHYKLQILTTKTINKSIQPYIDY